MYHLTLHHMKTKEFRNASLLLPNKKEEAIVNNDNFKNKICSSKKNVCRCGEVIKKIILLGGKMCTTVLSENRHNLNIIEKEVSF